MKAVPAAALLALLTFGPAAAQEPIKIGFISTFSGPSGVLGQELLDGFKLGVESLGGKLGGRPAVIIDGDDQTKPDVGRQLADKMVERDKVQILTGVNFSNVMLALAKPTLDAGAFIISVNAGPSQYAGAQCNPHFFVASFQNDTASEAMGVYMTNKQIKRVYLMAPNYPAGKDFLAGFKRTFKGEIAGEVYTTFGQLDYAAEIAQLRAAKPDAVYFFYPGGMGTRQELKDDAVLDWLRNTQASGTLMTSVCTGALVYAAAGKLWEGSSVDGRLCARAIADFGSMSFEPVVPPADYPAGIIG